MFSSVLFPFFSLAALWNSGYLLPRYFILLFSSFSHLLSWSILEGLCQLLNYCFSAPNTPFPALLCNTVLRFCKPHFCLASCSLLGFTSARGRLQGGGVRDLHLSLCCRLPVCLLFCECDHNSSGVLHPSNSSFSR